MVDVFGVLQGKSESVQPDRGLGDAAQHHIGFNRHRRRVVGVDINGVLAEFEPDFGFAIRSRQVEGVDGYVVRHHHVGVLVVYGAVAVAVEVFVVHAVVGGRGPVRGELRRPVSAGEGAV